MESAPSLRDATVQEIQLELIRRTRFNAMDGPRIVEGLLRHRHLWEAVIFDKLGLPDYTRPSRLLMLGLIKLRDLSENYWNVDTLYVLTPSAESATDLKGIAEREEWGGMARTIEDRAEIDTALGTGRSENGLLIVWWD